MHLGKTTPGDIANDLRRHPRIRRHLANFAAFVATAICVIPPRAGYNTIGQPQPNGWHNSHLAADEPFEIVASGPLGPKVQVTFYADLEPLKVVARDKGNPYRLRAQGLPPGLHVLYAVTSIDGREEISRPVSIMFHRRQGK